MYCGTQFIKAGSLYKYKLCKCGVEHVVCKLCKDMLESPTIFFMRECPLAIRVAEKMLE